MENKLLTIAMPSYNAEQYLPDTIPTILSAKNAHLIDLLIVNDGSSDNTGTAKYGLGRYTTTDKKYASKFGNVREVHLDELPSRPLSFKDELAFQMFEQELAKEHGMKLKHMNQYNRVDEIIQKMGYNGLTIGPKNNMIIVSYWTPKDYDKVRGY